MHALPRIAGMDPADGYAVEALMSSIAQADSEAKTRLKDFLEKRGAQGEALRAAREAKLAAGAPLRPVRLGTFDAVLDRRSDGVIHLRTAQVLGPYHAKLSEPLEHWAKAAPDRVFLAERDGDGWRTLTYAETLGQVRRIAAALLRRGCRRTSPSRSCPATASSTHCWDWRRCMLAFLMRRFRRPIR